MKKIFQIIILFILIILVFTNYNIVLESTIYAVNIWLYKVFPYLFIMIIINDLLINSNILTYFKNPSIYIFIMSLLSGTPSSAYITSNLKKEGIIDKNTANNTLLFTYFSNPLFLYTILKTIFNANIVVIKLISIHYISNIIIYFFKRKKLVKRKDLTNYSNFNLPNAIKNAINTTTMVLGTIVFFLVISNILINTFSFSPHLALFIKGLLEITQGLDYLSKITIKSKELIAIAFLSFGGLSIHTQVKCILDNEKLDYKYFLKGRIYGTIIAIILTIIF